MHNVFSVRFWNVTSVKLISSLLSVIQLSFLCHLLVLQALSCFSYKSIIFLSVFPSTFFILLNLNTYHVFLLLNLIFCVVTLGFFNLHFHSLFCYKALKEILLHLPHSLAYLSFFFFVVESQHIHSNWCQVEDWESLCLHEHICSGFHTDKAAFHDWNTFMWKFTQELVCRQVSQITTVMIILLSCHLFTLSTWIVNSWKSLHVRHSSVFII